MNASLYKTFQLTDKEMTEDTCDPVQLLRTDIVCYHDTDQSINQ